MHFQEVEEHRRREWSAGDVLPSGLDAAAIVPPEVEDARRRFILSLRSMTARKEKQERDAAAIRQWMGTLESDVAAYRQWKQRKLRRQLFIFGIVALVLFSKNISWLHGFGDMWWFFLFGAGGTAAAQAVDSKRPREMARLLATSRDPRSVSVLAVAARDGDQDTKEVAVKGLKSILPQLRASDSEYVTDQGMNALLNLLGRTPDASLQIAILRSLEQVGDDRAFSMVDLLASIEADSAIGKAAQSCRRFLVARAEQERLRNTLLRPAADPVEPDKILLRPAGSSETPSEHLLRPT